MYLDGIKEKVSNNLYADAESVCFRVGMHGVPWGAFNDPMIIDNLGKGIYSEHKRPKYIAVILYFHDNYCDNKDKRNALVQRIRESILSKVGNSGVDFKDLGYKFIILQKIKSRSQSIWNLFLRHGEDGQIPITGTLWFLSGVEEAFLIEDQFNEWFNWWSPIPGDYQFENKHIMDTRRLGPHCGASFGDDQKWSRNMTYYVQIDIYEALGIRNYFKYLMLCNYQENDSIFWESFTSYVIAYCCDKQEYHDLLKNDQIWGILFDEDAIRFFKIIDEYNKWINQYGLKESNCGYRNYLVWKEVQRQKEDLEKKRREKEWENEIPF